MPRKKLKTAATVNEDLPQLRPKGPNFMDLPLELRIEIYKHLKAPRKKWGANSLFPRRVTRQSKKEDHICNNSPRFDSSHTFPTSILLLNKLIHAEASDALYRNMKWHFYVNSDTETSGRQVAYFSQLPCYTYVRRITLSICFPSSWGVLFKSARSDIHTVCTMLSKLPLQTISIALTQWLGLVNYPFLVKSFVEPLLTLPAGTSVDWTMLESRMVCENCWHGHNQIEEYQVQSRDRFQDKLEEALGRSVKREKIKKPLLDPMFGWHW